MHKEILIYNQRKYAFTLAETLITLVVIGVVAALTVPMMMQDYKWKQYKAGALKAISQLNQLAHLYQSTEGESPMCGYWENNPYVASGNGAKCTSYSAEGNCTGYSMQDGSPLPSDYNGYFSDCGTLYNYFKKRMKTIKICDSKAYEKGCIPKYEGYDTIYKSNNTTKTDYEINLAVSGAGFKQNSILNGCAFITADGAIYFSYTCTAQFMAFDVNGFKGPNKWGYDVYAIIPYKTAKYNPPKYYNQYASSGLKEKGGKTLKELINQE